jgi:uncharacterized protein (DUF2141 family)
MKWYLFLVLVFILHFYPVAQMASLKVEITNVHPLEGKVMLALFNSKETYFDIDEMYAGFEIPADSSVVTCTFQDLPPGIYAITIYHDEDSNGEMNRSWLGMPKEGYAFSNNFKSAIKPASFSDAAFQLEKDTILEIKMNY